MLRTLYLSLEYRKILQVCLFFLDIRLLVTQVTTNAKSFGKIRQNSFYNQILQR